MPSKCAHCCKDGATKYCSKCKEAYYCDTKCQRSHWKQHKLKCYKFKLRQRVGIRIESPNGSIRYANGMVTELLPQSKYRVKLDRDCRTLHPYITELRRVVTEKELKAESFDAMKLDLNKHSDILDLYLQGRECKNEMNALSQTIRAFLRTFSFWRDPFMNETRMQISSQLISMTILEYLFEAEYTWRISCFWCEQTDVAMHRTTARTRCIEYGAHTLVDCMDEYSIFVFCDACNAKLYYDDLLYGCLNQEHDICLKCTYNKKIKPYLDLMDKIRPILINYVDADSARTVIEYIAGDVIQFNK